MDTKLCFLVCTLTILGTLINAAPEGDKIDSLPGLDYPIPFNQYSGYLDGGDGRHMHYYFVESERDSKNDPVVLWLTGGPGCSSLYALFYENGPFKVSDDGQNILDNPYSWNKIANVLYLESPSGVGFSYRLPNETAEDDDSTSKQNFLAVQDFFKTKFPEYAKNDFYITGESYAGIYIPTLVVRILNETNTLNFKGYAIGNGYVDPRTDNGGPYYFYIYGHGLRGKTQWASLIEKCCNNQTNEDCAFTDEGNSVCSDAIETYLADLGNLNPYNIYDDGDSMLGSNEMLRQHLKHVMKSGPLKEHFNKYLSQKDIPNDSAGYAKYLNRQSVREALHIPDSVQAWAMCGNIDYNTQYDSMREQFQFIVPKVRGTIYNGDFDTVCSYLADEWFVERLGLEVKEEYKPWSFDGFVGGYRKRFANLDFVTIRASGHMVPHDKPGPALKMINTFLDNA